MNGTHIPELTTTYKVCVKEDVGRQGRDGVVNETEQADVSLGVKKKD
jgi:hypothetical protein